MALRYSRSKRLAKANRKPPMIASLSSLSSAKLEETFGFYLLRRIRL
jgi:hypothetical protein